MRFSLLLMAAYLACTPAVHAQEDAGVMKGSAFLQYCRSTNLEALTTCDMTLFGIVVMHGIDQEMGHAQKLFCVPPDMKPPEIRGSVVRQLDGQTALLDQLYAGAVVVALAKAFPCRK